MAFNKQTFQTRAITAIIFAAVMLAGLLINEWTFFILFSIIHFGCWWEYLQLIEKIRNTSIHIYSKMGWCLLGYGIFLLFCGPIYSVNGYGLRENFSLPISIAGFVLLIIGIFRQRLVNASSVLLSAAGLIYISLSWGLMMLLRQDTRVSQGTGLSYGILIPCIIIFSIWINDTMAYIVGSFIGKTALSPISPKKTWEGTIGGIVLAVLVAAVYIFFAHESWLLLPITFIAAIAGTFGDLLESKLKRMAGVKDSGSIMPGHGGFMDRFDSLLVAIPFVWIYLAIASWVW
jgi:phosphatidate cytidylyltransferase